MEQIGDFFSEIFYDKETIQEFKEEEETIENEILFNELIESDQMLKSHGIMFNELMAKRKILKK